ncbi:TetR/AcrR family transcriptional regulator [Sporosarcina pasteurii]|uniref:DNA-binding transcriptional repressor AcrR n=1 Tax=Sporosarcina pasteurii TaxID=1474 RepID=A0A380BRT4_SPOPA|nr:TetR/AcrR family transcriptional regulator [Sporosarcina pasteurii]MDS9471170.1 TetR/AcrR family transcriptional regulator [Sporosarcina pasteurii]QBQ05191.1 TetR/AcrR family transcriptional regulator [Sporosarcina pasteurii]SUJ05405.1 DNA-binding transcriptional repressor AcrR [Sporosarcina pasteurii]
MQQRKRPLGRPRKEHGALSTKDKILWTATDMFLKKGYSFISMDDVAAQCDVTKATVYYYYKTKADLFTDAMVQLMVRIKRQIVDILSTNEPLKTQLFKLAKAHLQATVDIDINSFMKEAAVSLSDEQLKLMQESEDEMYAAMAFSLQEAMDQGIIPQSNPHLGAVLFVSMLAAGNNMNRNAEQSSLSLDELVTEIMNLFWDGLANPSA